MFKNGIMIACLVGVGLIMGGCVPAQKSLPKVFKQWPKAKSPEEMGWGVSEDILPRLGIKKTTAHPCEDAMWVFMARYAEVKEDQALMGKVLGQFDNLLTAEGQALISKEPLADHSVFGAVPLELYLHTHDPRYLEMGQTVADRQWTSPDANNLSGETRFSLLDMYAITLLQVQAYRATGDSMYLDRAARHMVACLNRLQRPNGLFYHDPDFPYFFGRGNGWAAVGLTELLLQLPESHPQHARVFEGYLKMMTSLLSYQDDDGLWHQLIDYKQSYKETSCTAMFTYAFVQGVKRGWLSEDEYGLAVRNSWLALADRVDEQGQLEGVCGDTPPRDSLEYYLTRPKEKGNAYGQVAMLWCIVVLL